MKKKLNCVLLVDDDNGSNFINHMIIDETGITERIEIALNGKEAIDYLIGKGKYEKTKDSNPHPDLILLDINMPVMDGWEFITEYQNLKNNQKSKTVIVILTTSLNPDDKKRSEKISEISEFKNKPLSSETIFTLIKNHFGENF